MSGPILSYIGMILYFILRNKKFTFISCDGVFFLKMKKMQLIFGWAEHQIRYQKNISTLKIILLQRVQFLQMRSKLLTFYPTLIANNKMNKNFKFVYISENKKIELPQSLSIWKTFDKKILERLDIINDKEFWNNISDTNPLILQQIYIDIKSLIRIRLLEELNNKLSNKLILVGSNWQKLFPNALKDNYSNKFIEKMYKGNICIDFGSKNSEKSIYPRSCKIIESGGILFQSKQKDSKNIFGELFDVTCFKSLNDMNEKVDYLIKKFKQSKRSFTQAKRNFEKRFKL